MCKFFLYLLLLINFREVSSLESIILERDNHVSLVGSVDNISINKLINDMNKISKNKYYFYINSPGGYVEEGERLVSHMRFQQNIGKNISCIAENAHSMAFYIFQNCNQRLIIPSSKVMQHQITIHNNGQLANINSYIEMISRISHRMNTFCSKRIGISLDEFSKRVMTDWWLYGEDIITNNVADKIVLVGCNNTANAYLDDDGLLHIDAHPCPLVLDENQISTSSSNLAIWSS